MTQLVTAARTLATIAHDGQVRRYTGEPYINHPTRVCGILSAFGHTSPTMQALGFLHDVIEDTGCTHASVARLINEKIADLVVELTKVQCDTRAASCEATNARLARASAAVQVVKLADIYDNCKDLPCYHPQFARSYFAEKRACIAGFHEEVQTSRLGVFVSRLLTP